MTMLGNVNIKGHCYEAKLRKYRNGRPAIELLHGDDGTPAAVATLNIPEYPLDKDELIVKDYDGLTGLVHALASADIVVPQPRSVELGYAVGRVCKLREQFIG